MNGGNLTKAAGTSAAMMANMARDNDIEKVK
jgi:hypothetical protein